MNYPYKFMLSPMAGVTNAPFRSVCKEFEDSAGNSSIGLYVDEMVAARAISGRISKVKAKVSFAYNENFRSMQLYCLDAKYAGLAAEVIQKEDLADHIDLNFGCPMRKVTKSGGGSAIPLRPKLLRNIIKAVKHNAPNLLISAKFRTGLDEENIHYLETGQIAYEEGCGLVTLHARTTSQYYGGTADWNYIRNLREHLPSDILVFGNGDIWGAKDALKMLAETNCDGVAIGRGALGRPWLFRDMAEAFAGNVSIYKPSLGEVVDIMLRHLQKTIDWIGVEETACKAFRVHVGPYLKGFPTGSELKINLMKSRSYKDYENILRLLDASSPYPESVLDKPRGRTKSGMKVYLPVNWHD